MVPIQVYNLIHFKIYVYKAITKIKEKNIVFFILLLPSFLCLLPVPPYCPPCPATTPP